VNVTKFDAQNIKTFV